MEALRVGYRIPFDRRPPLSKRPLSLPAYSPQSIKGVALTQELQTLLRKGAVEPASQSPGFYSRLFLVQKASGSWRPIIDLSTLNDYITSSHFHMETPQSVLRFIRPGDWMISLDLQDAYLQVRVHHDSRRYLRFVVAGKSYQFRVLCFGLTTVPQVFTRIMAPVSAILHRYGVRMLRYLDVWLILASTELACLQSRDRLLSICTELGIQVNFTKSSLVPTQSLVYLGMEIQSVPFVARPTPVRVNNLLRLIEEFLSTPSPPASLWRRLLGHLSSLTLLVSGGMLRMRLLQLCLKDQWDFLDVQFQVNWSPLCREDLLWWARVAQLREGVSLSSRPRRQLLLRRFGYGLGSPRRRTPRLGPLVSSSEDFLNQPERASCSSVRPEGLRTPVGGLVGSTVLRQHHHSRLSSLFRRDVLFHPELHSQGDTPLGGESPCPSPSAIHHGVVQRHSGRSQSPQSGDRVGMDPSPRGSRSACPQVASSDRSVCNLPDREASDVFLTGLRSAGSGDGRSSPALGQSPSLRFSSDCHHKESSCQTEVLEELRVDSHSSVLASEGMVPGPSGTVIRLSHHAVKSKRSAKAAPLPPLPSKSAYASADCMATIKRFARQAGFSPAVAGQLVFCRRLSTRLNYQARWGTYRKWCKDFGHRSSSPSIAKIADFLTYMFKRKGAALATIKGYRSMSSAVFKFPLPEISTSPILKDLIRSFEISAPRPLFPSSTLGSG